MMKLLFIANVILWNCLFVISNDDNLIPINITEFDLGKIELSLTKDSDVKKSNGVLYLPNCNALLENKRDEDYYELYYIGDLNGKYPKKVIKKMLYNGYEYLIIDTRHKCRETILMGKPHFFDSYIINFNESETTDSKKVIEIWKLVEGQIVKKKDFKLNQVIIFVDVRINKEKNALLLKDNTGKFWKISL